MAKGATFRWGKTEQGFAEALLDAGLTLGKMGAQHLGKACDEFMYELDFDWPRGKRYDAIHSGTGRKVRASKTYASGYHGGDAEHPWWSGNLHDSIVGVISDKGRILSAHYMNPGASEFQKYKGQVVDGYALAREAATRASHTYGKGISGLVARLVIAVPYALDVNHSDAHYDYVSYIQEDFINTIRAGMEMYVKKTSIVARKP